MMNRPLQGHKGLITHGKAGFDDLDGLPGQTMSHPIIATHPTHLFLPGRQISLLLDGEKALKMMDVLDAWVHGSS